MSIGGRMEAIAAEARIEREKPEDLIMNAIVVADSVAGSAKSGKSEGDNVAWRTRAGLLG
jgi:hypothetical protein